MAILLENKVAAITGGASGIGLECARTLINAGATVVLIDRDENKLNHAVAELGQNAISLVIDLMDPIQVNEILDAILEKTGRLDIFHANAGAHIGGAIAEGDPDIWDKILNLNINATFRCIRTVLPYFIERKSGDILFTSSIAGVIPMDWEPIYSASKFAVQTFVHATRRQVAQHGIRVGAILPGPVVTAALDSWSKEKIDAELASGNIMLPIEVAEAALFMLTRPRYITVRDLVILPNAIDL